MTYDSKITVSDRMSHISSKPFKPTFPVIVSDIVFLHNVIHNGTLPHQIVLPATATKAEETSNPPKEAKKTEGVDAESLPVPYVNKDKVFVDPRAVRKSTPSTSANKSLNFKVKESMGVQDFLRLVGMRMSEEITTWTNETDQHG